MERFLSCSCHCDSIFLTFCHISSFLNNPFNQSSGKTYTIGGTDSASVLEEDYGIILRAVKQLFQIMEVFFFSQYLSGEIFFLNKLYFSALHYKANNDFETFSHNMIHNAHEFSNDIVKPTPWFKAVNKTYIYRVSF